MSSASFGLVKLVDDHFKRAVNHWKKEEQNPDVSELGVLLKNRAHARVMALAVLLEDLCDYAVEKELVIPPEIDLLCVFTAGEVL